MINYIREGLRVIFSKFYTEDKIMLLKRLLIISLGILLSSSVYCASAVNDGADDLRAGFTDVTISQSVTGSLADPSQLFDYKIYFKDSGGNVITDTIIKYTGGVLSDTNVAPPRVCQMREKEKRGSNC